MGSQQTVLTAPTGVRVIIQKSDEYSVHSVHRVCPHSAKIYSVEMMNEEDAILNKDKVILIPDGENPEYLLKKMFGDHKIVDITQRYYASRNQKSFCVHEHDVFDLLGLEFSTDQEMAMAAMQEARARGSVLINNLTQQAIMKSFTTDESQKNKSTKILVGQGWLMENTGYHYQLLAVLSYDPARVKRVIKARSRKPTINPICSNFLHDLADTLLKELRDDMDFCNVAVHISGWNPYIRCGTKNEKMMEIIKNMETLRRKICGKKPSKKILAMVRDAVKKSGCRDARLTKDGNEFVAWMRASILRLPQKKGSAARKAAAKKR